MSFINTGGVVNAPFNAGGVAYGNGATVLVSPAGTAGQVLTSAGTGAPTWAPAAAGALSLISTKTVSGASVTFTGLSGYDKYYLNCENLIGGSAGVAILQIGTGATPTYITSVYLSTDIAYYGAQTANGAIAGAPNWSYININVSSWRIGSTTGNNTASTPLNAWVYLNGFTSGVGQSYITQSNYFVSGAWETYVNQGYIPNASNVTAIKLQYNTFVSGTISLYGISS